MLMRRISLRYAFGWLGFAGVVVLLGSLGMLTDFARALAPEEMVDAVIANSLEVITGAWRSFAFVLLAVGVILLYRRGKLGLAVAGWALAAVAAVDSWTIMRQYWAFSPPASISFASDAAIERILSDSVPSRVLSIELQRSSRRDPNLQGDGLMAHRIRTLLGYHGNQLGRYNEILQKDEGFQQIINPRIWELYNVRYLLTNTGDAESLFRGAQQILGPVKDAAGNDVYLYRMAGENPFAWVAPVIVKADDGSVGATLLNTGFEVNRAALFAPTSAVTAVSNLEILPPATGVRATVTSYAPGRISLSLSQPAPRGAALVVSENYYPGWSATVDGRAAVTDRVDYTLIGVELPEGGRNVDLVFSDPAYESGKLVTIIALLLSVFFLAAGIFREKRVVA